MNTLVRSLRLVLDQVEKIISSIGGLLLLGVTFVVFINAAGRYTVSMSFLGGQELSRLLTVWLTFLAAYALVRKDGHVTIDLFLRAVPAGIRRLFRGLVALLGTITMAYLTIIAWQLVVQSFAGGQTGTTLPVPRALFFVPLLIGAVLMTAAFAEKLLQAITDRLPEMSSLAGTDEAQ